ncbi:class I SAM-dependent methyltransferase [Engelhardtia mirabilis]|uniref:Demethylrebeccamycin-D-glucose O-methyltransferase n=1 Tax=Engelhardtia mirabilis TaxID=2528011 RepID=A0A518BSB3_9BACT|nr:Demethylrebeccamycin-D-glucose O-methyltransferase [Planctomycetes bacterium Pla133]QDV04186.1 Demethylrebeccamycin-D-glucose O-methyltransferase [Planctomycetes bacterium Pla86]
MTRDKIAETFTQWAEAGRDRDMETGHGDVVGQVIESLDVKPGQQILDLGCGNGWATRILAKLGPGVQAVGVDVAPGMLSRAEELHSYTIRARYELMPFEELEFKDGHFDRAFSMEALYYATDLDRCLAELFRVLKSGGEADVVIDYFTESPITARWAELVGVPMQRLSEAEWRAAFEQAGFGEVETRRVVDSRGPGDEADFEASRWYESFAEKVARHDAGSLWIRARKA